MSQSEQSCSVCGRVMTDYAVVGKDEQLCWEKCFGWFSGYPWVLFEMGMLKSDLWEVW